MEKTGGRLRVIKSRNPVHNFIVPRAVRIESTTKYRRNYSFAMEVILDVQGFFQCNNEFVPKELGAFSVQRDEEGMRRIACILFKPPFPWKTLSAKNEATNVWLTRNYHGIPWDAGEFSYDDVQKVLKKIVQDASYVYVKGLEKKQWVQRIIEFSKPVIDLAALGCPAFQHLQTRVDHCWHHKYHEDVPRYHCAFENVQRLRSWYVTECTSSLYKSLHLYLQLGSLKRMKAEDIAYLTKDFILIYGSHIIDEVWEKLSESMKKDEDIAGCRRCEKHYQSSGDEFDGPIPMIKNCPQCKNVSVD